MSAQDRVYGSADLRAPIDARTRQIYDAAGQRAFRMTRANPLAIPHAQGMELTGTRAGQGFSRIVAFVWTKEGKYGVEYYFDGNKLLLVFETFEYFDTTAPKQAWRNFKGIPGWSRRTYFQGAAIVYAEAQGADAPAPGAGAEKLITDARKLAMLLGDKPRP
jgi:hypothetical protein